MESLSIGALAKQVGLGPGALRYYERLGLLVPSRRTASGYRVYPAEAVRRLRFIRRAQTLGFSLEEVATLLKLSDNVDTPAREVKRLVVQHISDLEARIGDLERMCQSLTHLADRCNGRGPVTGCSILAALGGVLEGSGQ